MNNITTVRQHSQLAEPFPCIHSDSHHFHGCPEIISSQQNITQEEKRKFIN